MAQPPQGCSSTHRVATMSELSVDDRFDIDYAPEHCKAFDSRRQTPMSSKGVHSQPNPTFQMQEGGEEMEKSLAGTESVRGVENIDSRVISRPESSIIAGPHRVMPKNFARPLTCFYWATQGFCAKSDDECWYAHYWTDIVAAAPVRVSSKGSVAGREAEKAVEHVPDRNPILRTHEQILATREEKLLEDRKQLRQITVNLKDMVAELFNGLEDVRCAKAAARRSIDRHRYELVAILYGSDHRRDSTGALHHAISTANRTLDDLETQRAKDDKLKRRLKDTFRLLDDSFATDQYKLADDGQSTAKRGRTAE